MPPYFLFAKAGPGRDIRFRGVLAPGAPELTADEDLVAVWRSQHGLRFQNYRAQFTILDIATATRAWINDILAGNPLSAHCPGPWRNWITGRRYQALAAARIEYRSRAEQSPVDTAGLQIIAAICAHFASRPSRFESFATHLWQMADGHVGSYEVTRASVDGGRDAVGEYRIGPAASPAAMSGWPAATASTHGLAEGDARAPSRWASGAGRPARRAPVRCSCPPRGNGRPYGPHSGQLHERPGEVVARAQEGPAASWQSRALRERH